MFASLNSCRGYSKSRRDDIESALYILCYLLHDQSLPWSDIRDKVKKSYSFSAILEERLQVKYNHLLFESIPEEVSTCLKTVLMLKFKQKPPYKFII